MEIILSDLDSHPSCPHGPCLMFERYSSNGKKTGRRFFACSACRDRSDCNFFHWVDDDISMQSKEFWKQMNEKKKPPFSHECCMRRLKLFKEFPQERRRYCQTCSILIVHEEKDHVTHNVVSIDMKNLNQPSSVFETLQNKKVEAQYFFTDETVHFVVTLLKNLGFTKFVLIGVPKIHEYLACKQDCLSGLSSFLLDIDHRYRQFFGPDQFSYYNIFNNYFFDGKKSKEMFKKFLMEKDDGKVVVLLDPPFGGLIDAISHSLKKINAWWQELNGRKKENVPLLWFFPYFHEKRIKENMPDMLMIDYKVEYLNHKKFGKKISVKGSPVRIFTNIKASTFVLPADKGYRFCSKCKRYVSEENKHCVKCNACTTKHGKTYQHCDQCQQCVKNTYKHCKICNKCTYSLPTDGTCSYCNEHKNDFETCFKCHGVGHRKRNCPHLFASQVKKSKKKA